MVYEAETQKRIEEATRTYKQEVEKMNEKIAELFDNLE